SNPMILDEIAGAQRTAGRNVVACLRTRVAITPVGPELRFSQPTQEFKPCLGKPTRSRPIWKIPTFWACH
ncbi:MAG: hypothetical protein ACJ8D4_04690, partial [Xanthobacteraceae bacterium]